MTDPDTDLTSEESRRLRGLRDTPAPPKGLEERTVESLYRSGALRKPASPARGTLIRIAAAAAIFTTGLAAGIAFDRPIEPRYVLLLAEPTTTTASDGDEDEDARVSEYAAWARQIRADGVGISGARLANDMDLVGPPTDDGSSVSGFFLIDVEDGDRALEIARSCPHTRYGGSILLGRVLP